MIMAKPLALKKVARHTFLLVILLTAGVSVSAQTAARPQSPAQTKDVGIGVSEKLVDSSLDDDPVVTKMVAAYSPKVRELDVVLGRLTGELKKGGVGSGSLGNFVTDGMRWQAMLRTGKTITLAVMNGG